MSCKTDTNCSQCFNTAAGCISRHQLVQFHNRMGPRAQRAVRYTVWQHKCHNSSFLTVQYFIRGQQFVPVRKLKIEAELIFWEQCQAAEQCTFHARLLNEENLIIQTEAVEKPHWHSPEQDSEQLISNGHCRVEQRAMQTLTLQHRLISETLDSFFFFLKDQMVLGKHCSILVTFFFQISIVTSLLTGSLLRMWLSWITSSDFIHWCLMSASSVPAFCDLLYFGWTLR